MAGNTDKAKGRIKQAVGDLTDDDELKADGEVDELAGKTKDAIDDIKNKAENVVDKAKENLT